MRVFPISYGEDADLATLRRIAEASQAAVYDSSDPRSINKVFIAVSSATSRSAFAGAALASPHGRVVVA